MWFGDVSARALVARVSGFGNKLRQTFVQPKRDGVGIKAMHDEMHDFVAERFVVKLLSRTWWSEQPSHRRNPAVRRSKLSEGSKCWPSFGPREPVDMKLNVPAR